MSILSSLLQLFPSFQPGSRLVDGGDCLALVGLTASGKTGLTAHAGGGSVGVPQLAERVNEITVCATADDSVQLPFALPGTIVTLINHGAQNLRVYAQTVNPGNLNAADTIVPLASLPAAAVAFETIASAGIDTLVCAKLGQWKSLNV